MAIQDARANIELTALLASTVYLSLYSVAPTESTDGTELTGNGYARAAITSGQWTITGNTAANNAEIVFPAATGDWAAAVDGAINSAATAGTILRYGVLTASKTIASGETARYSAGAITLTLGA